VTAITVQASARLTPPAAAAISHGIGSGLLGRAWASRRRILHLRRGRIWRTMRFPADPAANDPFEPPVASKIPNASTRLEALAEGISTERISLGEILDRLGSSALGLLLLILTIPALIPIPGPFGMIFGTLVALVAAQLLLGNRRMWLPQLVRARQVPASAVKTAIAKIVPYLRRAERYLKPRRMRLLTGRPARTALGLPIIVLGLAIALPIPLGNLLPALALIAFSLGFLARDGVAILAALGLSAVALGWVAFLLIAGTKVLDAVWGWLPWG
jgi:hypothetical protein